MATRLGWDYVDIGTLIGIGVDAAIGYILYRVYRSTCKAVDEVKNIQCLSVGPDLLRELEKQPDKCIPYVCVDGIVTTLGSAVRSHYGDQEGVLQNISLVEHKSKRSNGVWTDVTHVIRDIWESVPLYLRSMVHEEPRILVIDPRSAKYLEDDLTTTYDKFDPSQSGIVQRGIDRIAGEVLKGYHETERMLLKGSHLVGMGKLAIEGSDIKLRAPTEGQTYILTRRTREEVISKLSHSSTVYKVFLFVFGGIGCTLSIFLVVRLVRKLIQYFKNRHMAEELRRAREEMEAQRAARARDASLSTQGDDSVDSTSCVICLSNPREVVLLDCGHLCVCADCVLALPEPKKCPICRRDVARFVATYNP